MHSFSTSVLEVHDRVSTGRGTPARLQVPRSHGPLAADEATSLLCPDVPSDPHLGLSLLAPHRPWLGALRADRRRLHAHRPWARGNTGRVGEWVGPPARCRGASLSRRT